MTPDAEERYETVRQYIALGRQSGYDVTPGYSALEFLKRQIESLESLIAEGMKPDPGRAAVGRFHRDGPVTEKIAARKHPGRKGSQRFRTLEVYRAIPPGQSDDELHFLHGIGAYPHVAGTRREELIADGWPIVDSGVKRRTRAGDLAIVWRLEEDS